MKIDIYCGEEGCKKPALLIIALSQNSVRFCSEHLQSNNAISSLKNIGYQLQANTNYTESHKGEN